MHPTNARIPCESPIRVNLRLHFWPFICILITSRHNSPARMLERSPAFWRELHFLELNYARIMVGIGIALREEYWVGRHYDQKDNDKE